MREYIYRGKSLDNGKWIKGYYIQKEHPYSVDGQPIIHFIMDLPPFGKPIMPETLGQYIGMKDINGRKIFEGDIVRHYNVTTENLEDKSVFDVGVIYFDLCTLRYRRTSKDTKRKAEYGYAVTPSCRYEVIGNIYDNEDLIRRKR